jgi:hypothetical protein
MDAPLRCSMMLDAMPASFAAWSVMIPTVASNTAAAEVIDQELGLTLGTRNMPSGTRVTAHDQRSTDPRRLPRTTATAPVSPAKSRALKMRILTTDASMSSDTNQLVTQ